VSHPGPQLQEISMRSKQRGITFIGWVILLVPIGICVYAGIRLAPIYLNYMNVAHCMEQVKTEFKGGDASTAALVRESLGKHLQVDAVTFPDLKDFRITRDGRSWVIDAAYDDQAPLFANVSISVSFDKTVTLGSEGGQ
jgi:hypothetical protein